MNKPNAAFVIVCWNNNDLLEECLDSIKNQTFKNHKTIIVDNGSTDDSVITIKKIMPEAIVIESKKNLGFAKGNNVGINEALKDQEVGFIALLNTDARLDNDWLEKLIIFTENKPKAACLQSTTLDYYDQSIIDSTHIYIAQNGQATQGSWRDDYESEMGPMKVFGVNAAACLITRAFIDEQPYKKEFFDETMFMYLEDVDIAVRATVMGWDNYLVPGTKAYHMGSASSGKNPGFSLYLTFRNNTGLIFKNLPFITICKLTPRIFLSDIETFRHLRRLGKNKTSWIIPKGRIAGIFRSPLFLLKRNKIRKVSNIDRDYLWHLMRKGY